MCPGGGGGGCGGGGGIMGSLQSIGCVNCK